MNTKEQILDLYYTQHLKQSEIAKIVNTTSQYISKIVKTDERYENEKENRKQVNYEKRKDYLREYFKTYSRPQKEDNSYDQLIAQHNQDVAKLSYDGHSISDYTFAKWNRGMYKYDNNSSDLVLKRNITVACDVPKRISNVINTAKRVIC